MEKENNKKKKEKPSGKSVSEKLKERSREISRSLEEKIEIKDLKGVEKDIEKKVLEKGAEKAALAPEKPAVEKPPEPEKPAEPEAKKPPKTKKPKVKDIEKVEKEISRDLQKKALEVEVRKVYSFQEGLKKARELAKKRKFPQTFDLSVNVKGMNLKKPENRFSADFQLPSGRGKSVRIGIIADSLTAEAKKHGAEVVIKKDEIASLAKDKKRLKKLANEVEWLYGEISLMPVIGKSLGVVLGPRGKVPKPIPPNANIEMLMKRARDSVRIILKETPVIHVPVGIEGMSDEAVLKNIEGVFGIVKEKLPKGVNSIRSMYIKLTMGRPVKLEVK